MIAMMKSNKPNKAGGMPSVTSTIKQVIRSQRAKENIKNLLRVNKAGGFDCPGCAWGDSNEGMLHFCENGAKAIAWESTERTVDEAFFAKYSVARLRKQSDYWLEYQGRLSQPMRYNPNTDHYESISWDEAFSLIANKLNALSSADQAEFYTSGRASNEASYLYQLFGRLFGTNNFPDCSNMCHEASGIALKKSIGVGKGTVILDDFYEANTIFVYGQNPGTNHPRMMNSLRKAAKNGCKIVSINNLREVALEKFASPQKPLELLTNKSVDISHLYLTPKLGTDIAFIRGLVKSIIENHSEKIDSDFIAQQTQGFADYQLAVINTDWQDIVSQTGVDIDDIHKAASIFAHSKSAISTWAMGITQHKHSVDTIRELVNLHLMMGQIGRKGAGLCPVRGHSNVQGNRTMGINEKPSADFLARLESYFQTPMPQNSGHNVHAALKALHNKNSKVLICLGGNIAAAAPDSEFTARALKNSEFSVQISTKLNRSHLTVENDALILPCLGRTELDEQQAGPQQITVEDTFSMVHASAGNTPPVSESCLSETEIVAQIANKTLTNSSIDWLSLKDDYSKIRDFIANTIEGFEDFNNKIRVPFGFHLSNSATHLKWNTDSQKAEFNTTVLPSSAFSADLQLINEARKEKVFTLQTMRSHDQFNTTIYGMDDRYRGIKGERKVVFMNPKDARHLGFEESDMVEIESIWTDNITRKLDGFCVRLYDIPSSNLAGYYPELNPLIAIDSVGDQSFTPTSKSIAVMVRKSKQAQKIDIATT
jgi:molybdopterin-dependent oxidoreductase alpha subunit